MILFILFPTLKLYFTFIFTKSKSFKNGKKIEMFFQSTIIMMQ